jgi:hypothetical protein
MENFIEKFKKTTSLDERVNLLFEELDYVSEKEIDPKENENLKYVYRNYPDVFEEAKKRCYKDIEKNIKEC